MSDPPRQRPAYLQLEDIFGFGPSLPLPLQQNEYESALYPSPTSILVPPMNPTDPPGIYSPYHPQVPTLGNGLLVELDLGHGQHSTPTMTNDHNQSSFWSNYAEETLANRFSNMNGNYQNQHQDYHQPSQISPSTPLLMPIMPLAHAHAIAAHHGQRSGPPTVEDGYYISPHPQAQGEFHHHQQQSMYAVEVLQQNYMRQIVTAPNPTPLTQPASSGGAHFNNTQGQGDGPIVDGIFHLVLAQGSHDLVDSLDQLLRSRTIPRQRQIQSTNRPVPSTTSSRVSKGRTSANQNQPQVGSPNNNMDESVPIGNPWHLNKIKPKIPRPLPKSTKEKTGFRMEMPIRKHRETILSSINEHRLTIVVGRSGVGKSSQIPQYIMEEASEQRKKVRIIHANPHSITPVVLSQRVAAQRGEGVGDNAIGYQIFLESVQSPVQCILTFCSTSLLLRSLRPPDYSALRQTTHLILDDVDERDASTDFLLFLLTQLLPSKELRNLSVILILNTEHSKDPNGTRFIGKYFQNCINSYVVVDIDRNLGPWNLQPPVKYVDLPLRNYDLGTKLSLASEILYKIHTTQPLNEAVLIFVPNYEEMLSLKESIFRNHYYSFDSTSYVLHMVYPELQRTDLQVIFNPTPLPGNDTSMKSRRIILSTSVLESSLSIHDVQHIIDFGNKEVKLSGTGSGVYSITKIPICKNSAMKRLKLSGSAPNPSAQRWRMYNQEQFQRVMKDADVPEVLTFPLQEFCLIAASVMDEDGSRTENIFNGFVTSPESSSLSSSVEMLKLIGALQGNGNISNLGAHLLSFPVEPRFAKALIYGVIFRCIDPILTIVSGIASRDPFLRPNKNDEDKYRTFKLFQFTLAGQSMSDHFLLLKAFQEWEKHRTEETRPYNPTQDTNGLEFLIMDYICDGTFEIIYALRTELLSVLRASGFVKCKGKGDIKSLNENSGNWGIVKAILLVAMYPNVLRIDPATKTLITKQGERVKFHPDSCICTFEHLCNSPNPVTGSPITYKPLPAHWVIYDELEEINGEFYAKGCTVVNSVALALFGGSPDFLPKTRAFRPSAQRQSRSRGPRSSPGSHPSPGTGNQQLVGRGNGRPMELNQQQDLNPQIMFKLDSWIGFKGTAHDINTCIDLRTKVRHMIQQQLEKPGANFTWTEESYVRAIVIFLANEDFYSDMQEVEGLGRWPKFAGGNMLSAPRMGYERPAFSPISSPTSST